MDLYPQWIRENQYVAAKEHEDSNHHQPKSECDGEELDQNWEKEVDQ